jgi:hypothetical protein
MTKRRDETGSVAGRLVFGGRGRWLLGFGTDAPHRPPQEIRLLVWLLEAIASARFAAALPACFRLNFQGLLALRRGRGTALHRAIAFAAVVAVPIAISISISIAVAVAMAEAALVAPERPIVASGLEATLMARRLRLMMLRHRRMRRLEGFVEQILTLFVAEIIADVTGFAQALAIAIGQFARLLQLLAVGHDDAVVMLRVLQIVFAEHRITR